MAPSASDVSQWNNMQNKPWRTDWHKHLNFMTSSIQSRQRAHI